MAKAVVRKPKKKSNRSATSGTSGTSATSVTRKPRRVPAKKEAPAIGANPQRRFSSAGSRSLAAPKSRGRGTA